MNLAWCDVTSQSNSDSDQNKPTACKMAQQVNYFVIYKLIIH